MAFAISVRPLSCIVSVKTIGPSFKLDVSVHLKVIIRIVLNKDCL